MSYPELLKLLGQFNLIAWLLAAIASFILLRNTGNKGWAWITTASIFVVLRQAAIFFPGYQVAQTSDALFNPYMNRYVFGAVGAILLIIGFITLINNYFVLKTRLEERR